MKYYFFDLDGTLTDSRDDMVIAVNAVREKLNLTLMDPKCIIQHVVGGMNNLYLKCFSDYIQSFEKSKTVALQIVKEAYEGFYLENICNQTYLYPNVKNVMQELVKDSKIFVITNKPERHSFELLKRLNISDYIVDIMGGDSCNESKPSSMPLVISSDRHGFNKEIDIAIMIGDSLNDILAGKSFGAQTVWCAYGYSEQEPSINPDYIVTSPEQLLQINLASLSN